jgi:hypothetical protein
VRFGEPNNLANKLAGRFNTKDMPLSSSSVADEPMTLGEGDSLT